MKPRFIVALVVAGALAPPSLFAQIPIDNPPVVGELTLAPVYTDPTTIRDEILDHFQRSSYKISELARVMPADKFSWAPGRRGDGGGRSLHAHRPLQLHVP